jgi:hypothetical protein
MESMKSISIFVLLIYWSVILLAPVISKENKKFKKEFRVSLNR